MDRFEETQDRFGIRDYDGYIDTEIWTTEDNNSTYYNYNIDFQCYVPGHSAKSILKEMGEKL